VRVKIVAPSIAHAMDVNMKIAAIATMRLIIVVASLECCDLSQLWSYLSSLYKPTHFVNNVACHIQRLCGNTIDTVNLALQRALQRKVARQKKPEPKIIFRA
jgi:hypothetical protein